MKPKSKRRAKTPAELAGFGFEFLEQCVRLRVVEWKGFPDKPAEIPPSALARLRRLQRICGGLDIEVFAGSVIVDLLERVDEMRRDLERLSAAKKVRWK